MDYTKYVLAELPLKVETGLTFEQRIAAGKYDSVDPDISDITFRSYSPDLPSASSAILLYFGGLAPSHRMLQECLRSLGLSAPTLDELLAFGAQHSEEQRKYTIAGTVTAMYMPDHPKYRKLAFTTDVRELVLTGYARTRYLSLVPFHLGEYSLYDGFPKAYNREYRVLAVRCPKAKG